MCLYVHTLRYVRIPHIYIYMVVLVVVTLLEHDFGRLEATMWVNLKPD